MKRFLTTLIIISCISISKCYCQEKKIEKQKEKVIIVPIDLKDLDKDISIDAYESPGGGNEIYAAAGLQVMPEFPGGIDAFYKYLDKNINKDKLIDPTSGKYKVYFSIIIEKDGSMTGMKVLRDPGYGLGPEVLRVLKDMKKKWEPGIQNGKPVRASFSLPITITLP